MLLAFGATRFEACKPIAKDALKFALTPTINQMRYVPVTTLHFLSVVPRLCTLIPFILCDLSVLSCSYSDYFPPLSASSASSQFPAQ